MYKIVKEETLSELFNTKNIILIAIMGITLVYSVVPLNVYVNKCMLSLNLGERLIYSYCDVFSMFVLSISLFVIMAGTPFMNNCSFYWIARTSRKQWYFSQIIKIIILVSFVQFIYMCIGLAVGLLLGEKIGDSTWSEAIKMLMNGAISSDFEVYFPYGNLKGLSIFKTIIYEMTLQDMYGALFCILLFNLSLIIGKHLGFIIMSIAHIVSYILTEWILPANMIKYIPWANSIIANHSFEVHAENRLTMGQTCIAFLS